MIQFSFIYNNQDLGQHGGVNGFSETLEQVMDHCCTFMKEHILKTGRSNEKFKLEWKFYETPKL